MLGQGVSCGPVNYLAGYLTARRLVSGKPLEFIGFGAMDVTKPYEFIGFGAMDVTKPLESCFSTMIRGIP